MKKEGVPNKGFRERKSERERKRVKEMGQKKSFFVKVERNP